MNKVNSNVILLAAVALGGLITVSALFAPSDRVVLAIGTLSTLALAMLAVLKIEQVEKTFNSKMDAMLELTAKAARAEGVLEGERTANTAG